MSLFTDNQLKVSKITLCIFTLAALIAIIAAFWALDFATLLLTCVTSIALFVWLLIAFKSLLANHTILFVLAITAVVPIIIAVAIMVWLFGYVALGKITESVRAPFYVNQLTNYQLPQYSEVKDRGTALHCGASGQNCLRCATLTLKTEFSESELWEHFQNLEHSAQRKWYAIRPVVIIEGTRIQLCDSSYDRF